MSGYSMQLVQNNSTLYILVHLPLLACPCFSSSLSLFDQPLLPLRVCQPGSANVLEIIADVPCQLLELWLPLWL